MKNYNQIPSKNPINIMPNTYKRLMKTVNNKLSFLNENNLNHISNLLKNALMWLEIIPEKYVNNKCKKDEFLQLGVILENEIEIYVVLICCMNDKNIVKQKRTLIASKYFEDIDDKTIIFDKKLK